MIGHRWQTKDEKVPEKEKVRKKRHKVINIRYKKQNIYIEEMNARKR